MMLSEDKVIRSITPHKGGRTVVITARLSVDEKAALDKERGEKSVSDWIALKLQVEEKEATTPIAEAMRNRWGKPDEN